MNKLIFKMYKTLRAMLVIFYCNGLPVYSQEVSIAKDAYPEYDLDRFVENEMRYPAGQLKKSEGDTIMVQFTVYKDGRLMDVNVVERQHSAFATEARRIVSYMPPWVPAQDSSGANVSVIYQLPIVFDPVAYRKLPPREERAVAIVGSRKCKPSYDMNKYLGSQIVYPPAAVKKGVEGIVIVQFTVGADGKISEVKALRDPGEGLAREAERVVRSMPKWQPATDADGTPVAMKLKIPISFKLRDFYK